MPTTPEGDELLGLIRQYVRGRVHPSEEEAVVSIVATTLVTLMSEPRFYNHLRVVIDLQRRIAQLEAAIHRYQEKGSRPRAGAPRPKTAAKKIPKIPVRKVSKKAGPYNVRQFKRGTQE